MHHVKLMAIVDGGHNLTEILLCECFAHSFLMFDDKVVKIVITQFQNQKYFCLCIENLERKDYFQRETFMKIIVTVLWEFFGCSVSPLFFR